MSLDNLIISTCNQSFSKYLYDDLIIGKLAHTELKDGINKGEETDIIMPATVNVFGYDGSELPDAEEADTSIAKVKFNKGYGVHFKVPEIKMKQIENAPELKQKVKLAKEYGDDAREQAAATIDRAYGNLYPRAGHYLSNNDGSAINIDKQICIEILAYMKAKMSRGDKKGHTSWRSGQMVAIVPPEYQYYLGLGESWIYTESGQKKIKEGFVGHLHGWDIYTSNNVAQPDENVFMPLFGLKGKTLAGGVSKNMSLMSYIPDKLFDTHYKGYGYFGVGAPRSDYLGAVKIKAPLKLSIAA